MKIYSLFMALCLMLLTQSVSAQNESKNKSLEFKVTGNCTMCKKTIESSIKDKPGISSAVWNKATKIMNVSFDPSEITEEQIHQIIADSGYDTEKKKASDKSYDALPVCCQYKRTIHPKK